MSNVTTIGTHNSVSIGTSFNRTASSFDTAVGVGKQSQWRGTRQDSPNLLAVAPAVKKPEEKTAKPETKMAEGKNLSGFYKTNHAYFPPVDYHAREREIALFEKIRDKGGFSAKPWTASLSS